MISIRNKYSNAYHSTRLVIKQSLLIFFLFFICQVVFAQHEITVTVKDSVTHADSLAQSAIVVGLSDSTLTDSATAQKPKKPILEAEVSYASEDSLIFNVQDQRVFLFDKANVNYTDIGLTGNYIEFDYNSKIVMATGSIDSSGQLAGKPIFTQGSDKYDADTLRYNFDTRKGIIKNIITEQGEGFLHSGRTKRLADGEIHVSKGKYTVCDLEHPHFHIALTKAIAIPNDKIISGPAYLVFEDIPVPVGLPFGFFPNTDKRSSGFIIPEFRDERTYGFGLENGGWYFALNDYLDISVLGTIFSRGTWKVKAISSYTVRYKYRGGFQAEFAKSRINDDPSYTPRNDFKVLWSHTQDAKANPTRSFRASVDFSTSSYEKRHGTNYQNILQNQKTSSIAYSKSWPGRPFNFSANLNGSQNTRTETVNLTLPSMTFNMTGIYPFRGKKNTSDFNWFQNIKLGYNSEMKNLLTNLPDSLLFTKTALDRMQSGFRHSVSINLDNFRVLNFITITPSVSYSGSVHPWYIRKRAIADTSIFSGSNNIVTDTIHKITYAHAVGTALSVSANPKLYGMFVSTKPNSMIKVVRHVLTPGFSARYTPDMSMFVPDYYRDVPTTGSILRPVKYNTYSVYDGSLYSAPTSNGQSASASFSLKNNLEMKVRSKADTTGEGKKVVILDNLDFSTSYNPFAETFRWSTIRMSGSTSFFNRNMQVNFGSTFDPYGLDDSTGIRINKSNLSQAGKLVRLTNARLDISFSLKSSAGDKKKEAAADDGSRELEDETLDPYGMYDEASGAMRGEYVDFDIPWSVNVNYAWSYSRPGNKAATYDHTVALSGDVSLTPKWKIGANVRYDLYEQEFTSTNISIYRDLHCWEMRFGIVPFGNYKSYSFTIGAKSALLRDLKWDKRRSWRDNF